MVSFSQRLLCTVTLTLVATTGFSFANNVSPRDVAAVKSLAPAEKLVLGVSFVRRKNGCKVRAIYESGPAYKAGLRIGDYVLKVNDTPVDRADPTEIARLVSQTNPVKMEIRDTKHQVKTVTLTKVPRGALGDSLLMRLDDYLDELEVGQPVPDFTALPPKGKQIRLSELRGKPVLVLFWAMWNKASVNELVALQAVEKNHRASGLAVVCVNLDSDKGALDKFLADRNIAWPQHFDGQGFEGGVVLEWGVTKIPVVVLIDRDGNVVTKNWSGPTHEAELKRVLGKSA